MLCKDSPEIIHQEELKKKEQEKEKEKEKKSGGQKEKSNSFFENYPHFPFPEPHGEYANSTQEFRYHFPSKWEDLLKREGLKKVKTATTMFIPFNPLSLFFGNYITAICYKATARATKMLGKLPPFKWLGYSYMLVYEKK